MATTALLLRSLRRRSDLPSAYLSAYKAVSTFRKSSWASFLLDQNMARFSRSFSSKSDANDVIGIDLGTTNSHVAFMEEKGGDSSDDEEEGFFGYDTKVYLIRAIRDDDRHKFIDMLKSMDPQSILLESFRLKVLKQLCWKNALNCTTVLLEGKAGLPTPVDLNVVLETGTYPLHEVASRLSSDLVSLLLLHGARTDVRSVESDLLPLDAAFEALRVHPFLLEWTPKESIYKLVSILCLPQMKIPLETIRLLAPRTNEVNEVLLHYCKEGKLIEVAALLIVSNKLVMARDTLHGNDGSFLDGNMVVLSNIKEHMKEIIWSRSLEEADLPTDKRKGGKLGRMYQAKGAASVSALSLLKLFEMAGDAIRSYLQLQPSAKRTGG